MTTPEPVPPSWPTRISIDTTAGTVRAAMSATEPGGRSFAWRVCVIVGSGSVRPSAPSAVNRPDEPAGRTDQHRDDGEARQCPWIHPLAEQQLPQAEPRTLTGGRGRRRLLRCGGRTERDGALRVAPRVAVGAVGPEGIVRSRTVPTRAQRPLQRGRVRCRPAEGAGKSGGWRRGEGGGRAVRRVGSRGGETAVDAVRAPEHRGGARIDGDAFERAWPEPWGLVARAIIRTRHRAAFVHRAAGS